MRLCVELPIHISPLGASVHVAQHNAHPLLTAKCHFVTAFHTQFADVVTTLVISVAVNVSLIHFCHIA